jgi:hypothetical protein
MVIEGIRPYALYQLDASKRENEEYLLGWSLLGKNARTIRTLPDCAPRVTREQRIQNLVHRYINDLGIVEIVDNVRQHCPNQEISASIFFRSDLLNPFWAEVLLRGRPGA